MALMDLHAVPIHDGKVVNVGMKFPSWERFSQCPPWFVVVLLWDELQP